MRSNLVLSLTAIALSVGVAGVSAAPIDFTLQTGAMQGNSTAGRVQPPAGLVLNQKGLAAIKPAGSQPSASDLSSKNVLSSIAKMGTDNLVRRPELGREPARKQPVVRFQQGGHRGYGPSTVQMIVTAKSGNPDARLFGTLTRYPAACSDDLSFAA